MQEAYRFIINEILDGRVKTNRNLEKVKHRACREYNLSQFISNADILEHATPEERAKIAPIIKKTDPDAFWGGYHCSYGPAPPVPTW